MASILDSLKKAATAATQNLLKKVTSVVPGANVVTAKPQQTLPSVPFASKEAEQRYLARNNPTPTPVPATLRAPTTAESLKLSLGNAAANPTVANAFDYLKRSNNALGSAIQNKLGTTAPQTTPQGVQKNLKLSTLPARIASDLFPGAARATEAVTRPVLESAEKTANYAKSNDPNKSFLQGVANVGSTAYEAAKLYGGLAKSAPGWLASLAQPGIIGGLSAAAPEETQKYIRPGLEAYSILKSPQKLVAGLNVGLGYADQPISNAINNSSLSQPVKDIANLGLNLGENALSVALGGKIGKGYEQYKPVIQAGVDDFKKNRNFESALDAAAKKDVDLEYLDRARAREANATSGGESSVMGYSHVGKPISKGEWDKMMNQAIKEGDMQAISALTAGKGVKVEGPVPTSELTMDYTDAMREFANQGKLSLPEPGKRTPFVNDEEFDKLALRNRAYDAEVAKDKVEGEDMNNSGIVNRKAQGILNGLNIDWANTGKEKFNVLTKNFRTLHDGIKRFFGSEYDKVKQVVNDFDDAKGAYVNGKNVQFQDLLDNVVNKLGIKKGSKISAAVQKYGEGIIDLPTLKSQFPDKWQNVVEADKYFRKLYDTYLPELNAKRAELYPNNPDKLIPARSNYYRHTDKQPLTGFGQAYKALTKDADISPELAGVSTDTRPISKYSSIAQERKSTKTNYDAVGGAIDYIKQAEFIKHVEPQIANLRALAKATAAAMGDDTKANQFIEMLHGHANQIAGKTVGGFDQAVQKYVGRKALNVFTGLANQVKQNQIVMNIASGFNQLATVPGAVTELGPINTLKGLFRNFGDAQEKSTFLNERYDDFESKFEKKPLKALNSAKAIVNGGLEEAMMRRIWTIAYNKGQKAGEADPGRYADTISREIVGGRGIGEVPLAFRDKVLNNTILMYQLETGNLINRLKDTVKSGNLKKIAYYAVAAHAYNAFSELLTGRAIVLDPIQAAMDAYTTTKDDAEKDKLASGIVKGVGRLFGEVLNNMPAGSFIAERFPQYGKPEIGLPARKDLFGDSDPTRAGASIFDYASPYNFLPFGGSQVKKTLEGLQTVNEGVKKDKNGQVMYPVEQNVLNTIRGAVLGANAFPETKNYYDNNLNSLSESDSRTLEFMSPEERKAFYEQRRIDQQHEKEINNLRAEADRAFTASGNDPGAMLGLRKQFYEAKAPATAAQIAEKREMEKYAGYSDEQLIADIESGNKLAAYLSFDDRLIAELIEQGKDPAMRASAKEKINAILDDEEMNAYDDEDRALRRGQSVTNKVKKVWDTIK